MESRRALTYVFSPFHTLTKMVVVDGDRCIKRKTIREKNSISHLHTQKSCRRMDKSPSVRATAHVECFFIVIDKHISPPDDPSILLCCFIELPCLS